MQLHQSQERTKEGEGVEGGMEEGPDREEGVMSSRPEGLQSVDSAGLTKEGIWTSAPERSKR